ncbi:MAG: NUDIX domain-containing protein [bacterium]
MDKVQATCAVIYNNNNQFLLIKRGRDPFAGRWALVSGIGETKKSLPTDTAVAGEVDCDLRTNFHGKEVFVLPVENDEFIYETVVFAGTVDESRMTILPPYSMGYAWFTREEIAKLGPLAYEHNEILERY